MEKKEILKLEEMFRKYLKDNGVKCEEVLQNTPSRFLNFIKTYTEGFKPYTDFKSFEESDHNQMVVVETSFTSLCEHHLMPFFGKVFVAYLPTTHVIGVSKIIKLVKHLSKKPTIQEGLTEEVSKALRKNIPNTIGVAVVVHGFHTCVSTRYGNGWMTTASMHGAFKHNPFAKQEFLDYIKHKIKGEING